MANPIYARGPLHVLLQSSGGQWFVIGLGAITFFPGKVQDLLHLTFDRLSVGTPSAAIPIQSSISRSPSQPIIIHTGPDAKGETKILYTIATYTLSAVGIWVSYSVMSHLLPDAIKEMLPVTRKFFDKAVTNLGKGILNVKDILGRQILQLSEKQNELSLKQDQALDDLMEVKDHIEQARNDLSLLHDTVGRCEDSLEFAERLQSYTARGVKLLVKTIATMVPGDHRVVNELTKYTKDGENLEQQRMDRHETIVTPRQSILRVSTSMNPQERTPIPDPEKEYPSNGQKVDANSNSLKSEANVDELLSLIREGRIQPVSLAHS